MRALLHSLTGILCAMLLLAGMGLADGGVFHCGGHHHTNQHHHELADQSSCLSPAADAQSQEAEPNLGEETVLPDCCGSAEIDPNILRLMTGELPSPSAPVCGICHAPDEHSHFQISWEMLPSHQAGVPVPVWLVFTAFPHPDEDSRTARLPLEGIRERSPDCVSISPPPHLRCAPLLI